MGRGDEGESGPTVGHTELLVPPWGTRSPCLHPPWSPTPRPVPLVALELPSPHLPAPCVRLQDQCRALHLLVPVLLLQGNKGVSWVGLESQGERDGQGKHSLACPHPVATEPGRDEDLALAHQLVLGPAAPAPKRLLDEGGELGHALLALPLQVEELGTTMASAGSLSSSRAITQNSQDEFGSPQTPPFPDSQCVASG